MTTKDMNAPMKVKSIAQQMLAGQLDLVEGTRALDSLAMRMGRDFEEPYRTLKGIASQADAIPVGLARSHYAQCALERLDAEKSEFLRLFGEEIRWACTEILRGELADAE